MIHLGQSQFLWKYNQSDQIGRIFAHWVISCILGSFLKITKVAHIFLILYPLLWLCVDFDKNGLGYILSDFAQTHPVTQTVGLSQFLPISILSNRRAGQIATTVSIKKFQHNFKLYELLTFFNYTLSQFFMGCNGRA
jgi:hypothetical protein